MAAPLTERLDQGAVLGDGGYLLELERRGYVQAGPFTPEVSLTSPSALAEIHREFLRAGADVLQALTFYASPEKLGTVGLADKVEDLNRTAVEIARSVAAEGDALVAGNVCLTWEYDPAEKSSADRVRSIFERQLEIQLDVGIDFLVAETFTFTGEAEIATRCAKEAGLEVVTTMSFEKEPHSYEGDSAADCARKLQDAGADVVGLNCLRDPAHTLPLMKEMREAVSGPLACQPVAYRVPDQSPDFTSLPEFPLGLDPLQLTRQEMGDFAVQAQDMGIDYIGSCCGSVASHVRAMAVALGKAPAQMREWRSQGKPMSAYEYHSHSSL
ncbi:MAG TPA: homocysteine S-methyltransferase family protein [Actinomycetota bacterium]|nr:homocysteine S-methyltransferase family protein [Actinomycetota bacterium]